MQVPMIQKVKKQVDVPQVQFVDRHVHVPVHKHRHVPVVSVAQKHVDVPVIETVEKIVDVPVIKQVEVPQIHTVENIVEIPHVQTVEKVVEVPMVGETLQGAQTSTTQTLPPVRQVAPAEVVEVVEMGPAHPTEAHPETIYKSAAPEIPAAPMTMTYGAAPMA